MAYDSSGAPDGANRRPCILLIEDDASMSTLLSYNLRKAGYDVLTEADGTSGLEAATNYAVDLALVDIMLPQLDGLSLAGEVVRRKPDMPIIMLTALADRETRLSGFETGAVDYVTKPFDLDELLARIRVHLRQRERERPSPITPAMNDCEGVSIDRDTHMLRYCGTHVRLRHKELELLEKLLTQPSHLFTREELVQAVWHQKFQPTTRSLDVHIRRLRIRLQEVGAPIAIEAVRGVGYRIVVAS